MLVHLSVSNYALIDQLDLEINQGFTAITGETGAGKSILLGALGLVLGNRADLKALRNQAEKCIIEGRFKLSQVPFAQLFDDLDLDFEEHSIFRREITPSGKSRAFVNDTPVRLDLLQELAQHLIDVHSQHQNLLLNNRSFQLQLLDSFAANDTVKGHYKKEFQRYKSLQAEKEKLVELSESELGDADYLQFLFDELANAKLVSGEQAELEEALERMENSGLIESNLAQALELANGEDFSLSEQLKRMQSALINIKSFDSQFENLVQRLESIDIELDDIRLELESKAGNTEFDPAEQERTDSRLSQLIALQKKHQAADLEELIAIQGNLEARIESIQTVESNLTKAEAALIAQEERLKKAASALSQSRKKITSTLEKEIKKLLATLAMPDAQIEINLHQEDQFYESGNDSVNFLFTANKGLKPEALNKVASGGETSRVMLAIKAIMAQTKSLPTIIFDEIDTGVSGETAGKIGEILKEMGQYLQVISITHSPQIASLSKHQLKVYKEVENNKTHSKIRALSSIERVTEIARLLSGEKITQAAVANAKSLLNET